MSSDCINFGPSLSLLEYSLLCYLMHLLPLIIFPLLYFFPTLYLFFILLPSNMQECVSEKSIMHKKEKKREIHKDKSKKNVIKMTIM